MKRIVSLFLLTAMLSAALSVSAAAKTTDALGLSDAEAVLAGDGAKTVQISLVSNTGGRYYTLQADWSTEDVNETAYIKLSALTPGGEAHPMENSAATGRIVWQESNLSSFEVEKGGTVWSAEYTVAENTPAGTYEVSLDITALWGGEGEIGTEPEFENLDTMYGVITVTHEKTHTAAKAATDTEDGNIEYWYCPVENKYYSDEKERFEISLEDTVIAAGTNPAVLTGDANNDKTVNVLDATRIQRYCAKLCALDGTEYREETDEENIMRADANGDGKITVLDATRIQSYCAKLCNIDGSKPYKA